MRQDEKAKIIAETQAELNANKVKLLVYGAMKEVLPKFVGKKVTKRIATALLQELDDKVPCQREGGESSWTAYIDDTGSGQFRMFYLTIWNGHSIPWDQRVHWFLGRESDGGLLEEHLDFDKNHEYLVDRIAGQERSLRELDHLLEWRQAAIAQFQRAKADCGYLVGLGWRMY